MRLLWKVLLAPAILLLVAALGFTVWAYTPLGPMPQALLALHSDSTVKVEERPWLTFTPVGVEPRTGLILYPGGRVDPRSYAPEARAIAESGYLVVIVPMPFNLAVFGVNRANYVIAAHPEIAHWAIGGHSLGGAMAANYVFNNAQPVQGLDLWAAYPAGNNSLAGRHNLRVVSISATNDGLATPQKIAASRPLLPSDTRWVAIEGGNHAQFGWYGPQPGDGTATISRESQQQQTVALSVELLASLSGAQP